MKETACVELHCHSIYSDGILPPGQIAERLAVAGVKYAALADHDSIRGQESFRQSLARLGIGFVSGVELTTYLEGRELHILGYGFSLANPELAAALASLRPRQGGNGPELVPEARISCADGIGLLHRAGGLAFLAHPLVAEPDVARLDNLLADLRSAGLDGIEAYHPRHSPEDNSRILVLAEKHGLLLSAGTDFHSRKDDAAQEPGVRIPVAVWKKFRDALHAGGEARGNAAEASPSKRTPPDGRSRRPARWQSFAVHIVLPAALALCLFAGVLVFAILPMFERALLDRKREMIRELTNAAWSVLAEAAEEERQGLLTGEEARAQAVKRIGAMRYGKEGKDYFWLQDTSPRMIMHPYRRELNGCDLSEFRDPSGAPIFVMFSHLVKQRNEGYVNYVWQWKDDPGRLEPKQSYIRLFEPWGWIIGTGLYVNDVEEELRRLKRRIAVFYAGIFGAIVLLLAHMMRSSLEIEREKGRAEELLRETTDRYKTLVDAATEGMLFMDGGRCAYANPMALEMLGCSQSELELLDIDDIFPSENPENSKARRALIQGIGAFSNGPVHGVLRRRDGKNLQCTLSLRPAGAPSSESFLLIIRQTSIADSSQPAAGVHGALGMLLKLPASVAQGIHEKIAEAGTSEDVSQLCAGAPALVQSLLDNGANAPEIARMLSMVTDAATRRLLEIGIGMLGEPPRKFVFLAIGSQGRMEQTLFTDQDNAIIYSSGSAGDPGEYFGRLAEFVCTGLINSRYRNCKGKAMASNPKWCRPIEEWKELFSGWIQRADVQELMEFSLFFDFRPVCGDESLAFDLRAHVLESLGAFPRFFPLLARNALQFKPPMRLFGMVLPSHAKGEDAHHIDLKAAAMPIVNFARLYALQAGIAETNTCSRIEELVRKGMLLPSKQADIFTAHSLLLRLRLQHQAAIMQRGGSPDNFVDPSSLGHIEKAVLKECFNEIDLLQSRMRNDFLAGE